MAESFDISTSEMLSEITESISVSPSAEDKLKTILQSWDGKKIEDDL